MEIGIVGAGAAGLMAAITLARGGAKVEVFEKNEKTGKKLYITGKGRCNLTNYCDMQTLFGNIVHGEKYLRSALYSFTPADVMAFFEELGVPLTVERGNRVFPASGKSSDVIRALNEETRRLGVRVRLRAEVRQICAVNDKFEIKTAQESKLFDRVIVATGGMSYPTTGSTGDGYKFAKAFGHSVSAPKAALAGLYTAQDVSALDGLSLKNVRLTAYAGAKEIASEFGELQFTQNGMSGPIALSVSSYATREEGVTLALDLKPALDFKKLDARLVREFSARGNEEICSVLRALLPQKLNLYALKMAGIDANKKANAILKEERARLADVIKRMTFSLKRVAPFSEAIITSGGVNVSELKPSGESKLCKGLYFVGETVDVDALTGGFNLQIAWATANCAARDILKAREQN